MIHYEHIAALFKTLGDPVRLQIIDRLSRGELCACDLLADLSITQPTLSHHMKLLHKAELVHVERRATWAFYSLNLETVAGLHTLLQTLAKTAESSSGQTLNDCCCEAKVRQTKQSKNEDGS